MTIRPDFFYFMVYGYLWSLFNVGIRNKKNEISVMSDIHWWSMRLLSKRKPIFKHSEKLTIQGDRKLNSRHFDTKEAYIAMKSAIFSLFWPFGNSKTQKIGFYFYFNLLKIKSADL